MLVRDHAIGQAVTAPFSRHPLPGPNPIERDERGGRENLGERSRLERFRERTRPHAAVGAPRCNGQDLAGGGIEHHDVAAIRFHVVDRVVERAL